MGCSYTEGFGCYDESRLPPGSHIYSYDLLSQEEIDYQRNRFHELGWPNRLGKKLGYDKVLNLGIGGGSTSGNLKHFMEHYWDTDFEDYEVLIMWWLPTSHRFSFYSNDEIKHISPPNSDEQPRNDEPYYILGKEYLKFVQNFPEDTYLEQIFYLKLMLNHCKLKGFEFLWYVNNAFIDPKHFEKYPGKEDWINIDSSKFIYAVYHDKKNVSPICNHPNEMGYEIVSEYFYESIKNYHPNLIKNTAVDHIEWDWRGFSEKNFTKDNE